MTSEADRKKVHVPGSRADAAGVGGARERTPLASLERETVNRLGA
ncbi:hypothetical protein [Natronosalvus amylolyticus]|nr:hypothetical protein [Natronosalvus amylolyticus]